MDKKKVNPPTFNLQLAFNHARPHAAHYHFTPKPAVEGMSPKTIPWSHHRLASSTMLSANETQISIAISASC